MIPHINGAFLEPEHRGSTLTKDMLDDILKWAHSNSGDHITVDYETDNIEAANFWLKTGGFKPVLIGLARRLPW